MSTLTLTPTHEIDLTLTSTDNSVTVGSVGDGLLLSMQSVMKGETGETGEAMTENSEFTTNPLAYYILAKT